MHRMLYSTLPVLLSAWLLAGCQTHTSRVELNLEVDHACVHDASYRRVTDSYTTESCARLFGDTELADDAGFHELVIQTNGLANTIRVHESVWRQQRADIASGHTLESALSAAVTAVSKRLADVWPDAPPLCWKVTVLPKQTRLHRSFSRSASHCIPLELAVRHRGEEDAKLGNLFFVSQTVATQLHETCHVMADLGRGRAPAGNLEQKNVEELACNMLSFWLDNHLLGTLFNEPISTRFDELDQSSQQLVSDSQDKLLRSYAIPVLAERLALHRMCSDRFVSTATEIEKLLDLYREAYTHTGTLQRFVEDQLAKQFCESGPAP